MEDCAIFNKCVALVNIYGKGQQNPISIIITKLKTKIGFYEKRVGTCVITHKWYHVLWLWKRGKVPRALKRFFVEMYDLQLICLPETRLLYRHNILVLFKKWSK